MFLKGFKWKFNYGMDWEIQYLCKPAMNFGCQLANYLIKKRPLSCSLIPFRTQLTWLSCFELGFGSNSFDKFYPKMRVLLTAPPFHTPQAFPTVFPISCISKTTQNPHKKVKLFWMRHHKSKLNIKRPKFCSALKWWSHDISSQAT